jgi:hypothetical protein
MTDETSDDQFTIDDIVSLLREESPPCTYDRVTIDSPDIGEYTDTEYYNIESARSRHPSQSWRLDN